MREEYILLVSSSMYTDLFEEVHGHTSVSDPSNLVRRVETLPVAAEPVTSIGLVVLHHHDMLML